MFQALVILAVYVFAVHHHTKAKKVESVEKSVTYHEEGGVQARGYVPSVALSPAREMVGEDTSTPHAQHPDDVLNVHKALQIAHTRAQLADPDLQPLLNF